MMMGMPMGMMNGQMNQMGQMGCIVDMGGMGDMRCTGDIGGGKGDSKASRSKGRTMKELGTCIGVIKNFYQEKGYGFVSSEDIRRHGIDGDAYLHISQRAGYEAGNEVAFTLCLMEGRPQARNLRDPESAREEVHAQALGQAEKEMIDQLQLAGMGNSAPSKGG